MADEKKFIQMFVTRMGRVLELKFSILLRIDSSVSSKLFLLNLMKITTNSSGYTNFPSLDFTPNVVNHNGFNLAQSDHIKLLLLLSV